MTERLFYEETVLVAQDDQTGMLFVYTPNLSCPLCGNQSLTRRKSKILPDGLIRRRWWCAPCKLVFFEILEPKPSAPSGAKRHGVVPTIGITSSSQTAHEGQRT